MLELKAVIFDMDGVLIDTVMLHWGAYNEILKSDYGVSVADEQLSSLVGMSLPEQLPVLNEMFSISIDVKIFLSKANHLKETYMRDLVPKEGVVELLTNLKNNGILLAVGTSTSEVIAKQRLQQIGIDHFFEVIVGEESVAHHKPDPEVYLTCAKMINVASQDCVVVEDAPNGLAAAKSAGMASVAVQTTYIDKATLTGKADTVVDSLAEIDVQTFEAIIEKYKQRK